MKKKVVVFGGNGFLGSYVADELIRRGYIVTVADINKAYTSNDNILFKKVDINDLKDVKAIIQEHDIVYNFVAIANLDVAIHKPIDTFYVNVLGHLNILESCKILNNIERLVYASSAYALSNDGSFYGISKHSAEKITEEYYKRYGIKYTIIRYGSVYGERASHNNYIYNLLKYALENKVLEYRGDGQEIREYIHAADAAKLSVDIIEDDQYVNENIILTGVERFKKIELLIMIKEILNNMVEIKQLEGEYLGHYKITPYAFHPTIAKKLVANPYIDLGQGLVECIKEINKDRKIS